MSATEENGKKFPMAALGSYETTLPFKAIGLDVTVITEENEADVAKIINRYANSGFAALFMEEGLFNKHSECANDASEHADISIIPVPSHKGGLGTSAQNIRKYVERAVGMDIFGVK
ncbi:MAG: V-type ATP synthase subunit F [Synergistes sp.]|nr:V-type ATP synthase subunit F [Synergistes sp.]